MNYSISSINYCPVKSLSFQSIKSCNVKKNLGILDDRIFAFSRGVDLQKAKLYEQNPNERKLNNFLTLKNTPVLNKYNFIYNEGKLILTCAKEEIISISTDSQNQSYLLSGKLIELENSLIEPIYLLKNNDFPFYDTSGSNNVFNSISLVNLNSIKDFEQKINQKIEFQRFRANIYVNGVNAWDECNWIGKIIKINNVLFRVEKNIPRCIAINLKPNTNDNSLNLLQLLKKKYNHFIMGIYLTPLDDGKIEVGNKMNINL